MFNSCGRFIWLKRAGLGGLGWTGRRLVSIVSCRQMQLGTLNPSWTGPREFSSGVLLHPVSNLQVPAARGPQAFELPCMPEAPIGQRCRAIRGNLPSLA